MERRTFKISELRATEGKQPKIYGSIPYNSESEDMGYVEVLKPGCFTNALKKRNRILSFWGHDVNKPLGNTQAGTLVLRDTDEALQIIIEPDMSISWSSDAVKAVQRGDCSGFSFGFLMPKNGSGDRWKDNVREIVEVAELLEVSPTSMPAYPESSAKIRQKNTGEQNKMKKYSRENLGEIIKRMEAGEDTAFADYADVAPIVDENAPPASLGIEAIKRWAERPIGTPHRIDPSHDIRITRDRAERPFESLGEQMLAIRNAGTPGNQPDQRLFAVRAATGLNETTPSDGGFLIQQGFSKEIIKNAYDGYPLLKKLRRFPIKSNSIKIPAVDETSRATGSRHGSVRAYWLAEAAEKQASKPKFRQMELSLKKVVVLIYTTDELLEDAGALDAYLREVGPDEIGFTVMDSVINGSGSGMPLGIMNSGAFVTVSKEAGQAAGTIVYENIKNIWSRMPSSNRKNAIWLINKDVEPEMYSMSLSVGTGGAPVYLPGGGASSEPYASLFGRPVMPIEHCQTVGTTGDIMLIDPTSYILADHGGVKTDVSIHVRFIYDESVFRFVYRVDGQPAYSSPVTPYKGTNTLSPFVALETRA